MISGLLTRNGGTNWQSGINEPPDHSNHDKDRTMANPKPLELDEQATAKMKRAEQLSAAVCTSVMNILGHPSDLFRVSARKLWDNRYRVNVQTGADAVSVRIAHSFFVAADEKGNVVESIPAIARQY